MSELHSVAARMVGKGKGILAADKKAIQLVASALTQ